MWEGRRRLGFGYLSLLFLRLMSFPKAGVGEGGFWDWAGTSLFGVSQLSSRPGAAQNGQ